MRILLLCGKSGVGKSSIAYELCRMPQYHLIKSLTDRPRRTREFDHTFVSHEDMGYISIKDIAAYTEIDGYRYCTLYRQFKPNKVNVYVVDGNGLSDIYSAFPNASIVSVLIKRKKVYIDEKRKTRNILVPKESDVTFSICNNITIQNSVNLINEVYKTLCL